MRDHQDDLDTAIAHVCARRSAYPDNSEVYGVLSRVLSDLESIKESQR